MCVAVSIGRESPSPESNNQFSVLLKALHNSLSGGGDLSWENASQLSLFPQVWILTMSTVMFWLAIYWEIHALMGNC